MEWKLLPRPWRLLRLQAPPNRNYIHLSSYYIIILYQKKRELVKAPTGPSARHGPALLAAAASL